MSVPVVPAVGEPVNSPQRNLGAARQSGSPSSPRVMSQPQEQKIVQDILDCIRDMKTEFEDSRIPINDDNQQLQRFCAKLEYLLQCNMKEKKNLLGRRKDYWDYFCDCLGSTKGISDGIRFVKSLKEYKTSVGKGRGFLRFCLMHNRMADSIQACTINGKATSDWFLPQSLWLQQERNSVLINALYDLSDIQFDLAPRGYDLDNAWPSFAKKNLESVHNWNLSSMSRTSSMSSLISIPGQEFSPQKFGFSTTPSDMGDVDHLNQELSVSENLRSDLTDKIDALEQQKSVFQQSVAHTQGELDVLHQQLSDFKSQNQILTKEKGELKQRYDRLVLEQESKQKEWDVKENEHLQRKEEIEKLFEQVMAQNDKIHNQGEAITDLERQKTELKFEVKSLNQSIETNKEGMFKKEEEITTLGDKLKKQEDKNNELLKKLEDLLMVKNNEASCQLDSVGKLQENLVSMKELESQNLRLNSRNEEMTKKCDSLQSELETKCTELTELQNENQQNITISQSLQCEVEKLNGKNSENLSKISELEKDLKSLTEKLNSTVSNHENEISKFDMEICDLKSSKSDLEDNLQKSNQAYGNLQKEKENLQCEKLKVDENLSKLSEELQTCQAESDRKGDVYEENMKKLKMGIEEKEDVILSLQEHFQESENNKLNLENNLKEKNEEIQKLHNELKDLENKNQGLESQCLSLDKDLSSLKECQQIEKGSSEEIKEKLEEKMDLVKKLELQMDEVKVLMDIMLSDDRLTDSTEIPKVLQNSDIGNLLNSLMKQCLNDMKTRDEVRLRNKELSTESDQLQQEMEEKGRQFEDLKCSYENLQKSKTELELKNADIVESLNSSVRELKEKNSSKDGEILDLCKSREDLENQKIDLERQISEQLDTLNKSSDHCDSLENEVRSLQTKINESEEIGNSLKTENHKLQETLIIKETDIAELRENYHKTEDVLRQNSEKIESESNLTAKLQTTLREKDQLMENLNQKVTELNSIVDGCRKTEEGLLLEKGKLEAEIKDLVAKLTENQHSLNEKSEQLNVASEKFKITLQEKVVLEQKLKDSKEKQFDIEQKLKGSIKSHEDSQKENQQVLNKLEVERHNLKQHLEDAIKDIESIKHQLTQTSTELSIAYAEKDRLESEKNDLVVRQGELSGDFDRISKENISLTTDVENILEKVNDLSQTCTDLEEKLKNSDLENDILKMEIVDLKNEIEKLTSIKLELENKSGNSQEDLRKLNEDMEHLEMEKQAINEEKCNLVSKIEELQEEIILKSDQVQEEQTAKSNIEKELNEFKLNVDENKRSADSDLEKLKIEHEEEVEMLKQEVTSLQFQLSAEQIKYEQAIQTFSVHDTSINDMKDKLVEQESLIEQLEGEMSEVKSCRSFEQDLQQQEVERLNTSITIIDQEKKELNGKLQQVYKELENEKLSVVYLQTKLKEVEVEKKGEDKDKEKEIEELKSDTIQLKKKLIKLIKEKDLLWQKTDKLSYQQKLQAEDKWLDERNFTQCMGCKADFSFTLRKHHCRICGRIFCYQCSDNWIQTAHSSKKSRACNMCYNRCKEEEESLSKSNISDDLEDTVEMPKMHKSRGVMNDSASSTMLASSTGDDCSRTSVDTDSMDTDHMTIPGQVATAITVTMVDGNLPDEIKEKHKKQKDDHFYMISEEEVSKSLTESDHPFLMSDPNMTSSITISTDDLEKGQVNSQNETSIKPGKTFAVPVLVDHFNTTLCWEFNSTPKIEQKQRMKKGMTERVSGDDVCDCCFGELLDNKKPFRPLYIFKHMLKNIFVLFMRECRITTGQKCKDVVFAVHYQTMTGSISEVLIPPCKVDSHRQIVKGELTAKQLGIYSLVFDNTYSRLTTKKVTYKLWSKKAE